MPDKEELGTHVPGEPDGNVLSPQIVENAREEKARKKGWKPLDEYTGEPADWVDAKEFLGREPLFEANRDLKRQLKQQQTRFEADMKVISGQFAQMNEQAYKRALTDLQEQRDIAIIDKDIETVRKLDMQIDTTKQAHVKAVQASQTQQGPQETEYMVAWRGKNSWFDDDQTLQDEAVSIGVGYMMKNQGTTQEKMLDYVTDRIKKIYPEKFTSKSKAKANEENVETTTDKTVNSVEKSTPPLGQRGKSKGLSVGDLSDTERQVMRTFIKRGVLKDIAAKNKRSEQEEYLAQLADNR